ncbi:hypothetical protein D9M69_499090 [compost metagenome]
MGEGATEQLTTCVIGLSGQGDPAVLVDVEGALGIDVAFARLQSGFHDPHAVQLPAHQIRVDVVRRGDVGRFFVVVQLVGVVRNVHFLLADQLEVEAVHRPVEHPGVVVGGAAGGTGVRRFVGDIRGELHPALTRQVLPAATGLLQRVYRVDEQDGLARAACRTLVVKLGLEVQVLGLGRNVVALGSEQGVFQIGVTGGRQGRLTR